jgi:hypothetical protein
MTITPAELRSLLRADVIRPKSGLHLPRQRDLAALAAALSHQQDLHHPSLAAVRRAQQDCWDALDVLARALVKLGHEYAAAADRGDVPARFSDDKLRKYAALAADEAVRAVMRHVCEAQIDEGPGTLSGLPTKPGKTPPKWRGLSDQLYLDFADALGPANPGYKPGADVAARFIAAVVPLITGEQPKSDSVAVWLKIAKTPATLPG